MSGKARIRTSPMGYVRAVRLDYGRRCSLSLLPLWDRLACWRGSLEHVVLGWNEFSAENSSSVADARSRLKLNWNRALGGAICSVLTVDSQDRSLALWLHWTHQVAEVTIRVVRIELNEDRVVAPLLPNLGLKATVWRHVAFTHRPAEDVPCVDVYNSSRSTNSRDQEGSGGPAWMYDTPSVEDNVSTKECLDESMDKHKMF